MFANSGAYVCQLVFLLPVNPCTSTTGSGWAADGLHDQSLAPGGSASTARPASTAEPRNEYGTGSGAGAGVAAAAPVPAAAALIVRPQMAKARATIVNLRCIEASGDASSNEYREL